MDEPESLNELVARVEQRHTQPPRPSVGAWAVALLLLLLFALLLGLSLRYMPAKCGVGYYSHDHHGQPVPCHP